MFADVRSHLFTVMCERIPQLVIERIFTRDAVVPLSADDPDMDTGWRCIPVPPSDEGWVIFDTHKDRRTGWRRIRLA